MQFSDDQLLNMPIQEIVNMKLVLQACAARDRKSDKIIAENKEYKMRNSIGSMIVSDTIEPTLNHADGRVYDSKSKYYEAVRQTDSHIVEPGESYAPVQENAKKYREELNREIYQNLTARRR